MANALSRAHFIIGKFLAHFLTLMAAMALGGGLSIFIMMLNGVVEIDAYLGLACLLFLIGTAFFATFFLFLGIAVSAWMHSSSAALMILVSIWTILIVVIPQTSYLIGTRRVDTSSMDSLDREFYESGDALYLAMDREGIALRPPTLARIDNFTLEKKYARRIEELDGRKSQIRKMLTQREVQQYEAASNINIISPGFAFQYSIEALLGVGIERVKDFIGQGWQHRETLRQFLRARDATDPDSPHILFLPPYVSSRELDPKHIPRFAHQPLAFSDSIANSIDPIIILVLEALLALVFALWSFDRADLICYASDRNPDR